MARTPSPASPAPLHHFYRHDRRTAAANVCTISPTHCRASQAGERARTDDLSRPAYAGSTVPLREDRIVAESLLDAEQLVVLCEAIGLRHGPDLYLSRGGGDCEIGERGVLRFAGAC